MLICFYQLGERRERRGYIWSSNMPGYYPNYTVISLVKYLLVQISRHERGRFTNIFITFFAKQISSHICTKEINTIKIYSAGLQGSASA